MVEDTIPASLKRAEDFINQPLAQARGQKIPRSKPDKKKEKIKLYTVILDHEYYRGAKYQGTFKTKKAAVAKLKIFLCGNYKRGKDYENFTYEFYDEDDFVIGTVYIIEVEI